MRDLLLVQAFLQNVEGGIKLRRLNDGPWNDVDATAMELGDKVRLLLTLHDLLELQAEPRIDI